MAAATADSASLLQKSKMAKLPASAKVQKRPLHRPAIPSPYTSSQETKVVYVSSKTPFMSAVKRVDKLLRLAEKRAVQSATATLRNENPRKRRRGDDDKVDEISSIAQTLRDQNKKEEVVVKGTGKAIVNALDIGCWFKQRAEYDVQLRTGTVESVDDIEIDDEPEGVVESAQDAAVSTDAMDVSESASKDDSSSKASQKKPPWFDNPNQRDETRLRLLSVIEVSITLK